MDSDSVDHDFFKWKLQTLSKVDLSRKGSVDAYIKDLVTYINDQEEYCSTSSCSGRIVLLSGESVESEPDASASHNVDHHKGKSVIWYLVSHDKITLSDVLQSLTNVSGPSKLKFESFIMHIRCRRLQNAQVLQNAAISSGYRNSGITFGRKGRNVMLAVRGTHCLEVPLTSSDGKRLTSDEYIEHIVRIANMKFAENSARIKQFSETLQRLIFPCQQPRNKIKKYKTKPQSDETKAINNTVVSDEELLNDLAMLYK